MEPTPSYKPSKSADRDPNKKKQTKKTPTPQSIQRSAVARCNADTSDDAMRRTVRRQESWVQRTQPRDIQCTSPCQCHACTRPATWASSATIHSTPHAQRAEKANQQVTHTHTHTHTRLTALFTGLPGSAGNRKVKPIWILLKQETVRGSGTSCAICKSAPCSRQTTTPAPHHSVFYSPDALPAAQPTASKHWRHTIFVLKLS